MATTNLWAVKSRLDHLVDYVRNPLKTVMEYVVNDEKTIDKQYVTYINIDFNNPRLAMENTKKHYNNQSEILAFHGYQSFMEDEVDPELAHKIGIEFAKKMWGNRFEVIVSTHLDTDNIHNHFLLNSTSFVDGKRYSNTYNDIQRMRNISDELCKEYHLSVLEQRQNIGQSRKQHFHETSLRELVREDVNYAVSVSYTEKQFFSELELLGYDIKITEKNIALRHPLHQKFIRLKSLGDDYDKEFLYKRILELNKSSTSQFSLYTKQNFDIESYYHKYKQRKLTGFQRLYLHYQYVLKIIPRSNRTRLSPQYKQEYQEALKKLDEISKQTIILCRNNINTIDELHSYVDEVKLKLNELEKVRQKYRNDTRKCNDDVTKNELKMKAKVLTPEVSRLRKELAYCERIEDRSLKLNKFINENEKRKVKDYERNRI